MKITFLGTGTSVGIPAIGCGCAVCRSTDPRDRRRRTSLYIEAAGLHVVVDTPPDFREQALAYRIRRVDAVLFTHSHADHIFGFDDIRRYNTMQDDVIPAYASPETVADLRRVFDYIGQEKVPGLYRPRIEYHEVRSSFELGGWRVEPLPVEHGAKETYGFRFEADGHTLGYVPDCRRMPDTAIDRLAGVDVMILDALKYKPHITHLAVDESVALLTRIGARRSYLTHMCHDIAHAEAERELPDGILMAHDGLTVEW